MFFFERAERVKERGVKMLSADAGLLSELDALRETSTTKGRDLSMTFCIMISS